ncbi:MAG: amidohydrolase [Bacteroidia bacterium]|nr:amidohydrolase [Bacteroidia bacterium]
MLKQKIKQLAKNNFERIQKIRHHLHAHPELSFQEFETSKFICKILDELKIEYKAGFVKTGIVAHIYGKNPGKKIIALRGDMDALPITEKNSVDYCSKNSGVMHACGHDVHTSCLLGAAMILNELKNDFEGTVKLVFQPGEELLPGGASLMIKENALKDPDAELIIGQHVFPSMETGKVGFRNGMYMASTDEIYITVNGKGGHAAMPADYNSPLLIAAEILLELDKFFMKQKHFDKDGIEIPTVQAFGKIIGDGVTNVIPEKVELAGTFRTMNEEWRTTAHQKIKEIAEEICKNNNGTAVVRIDRGYPFLVNEESITNICRNAAIEFLGKENVEELPLRMTAEDFAWYSQILPSCFYRLGTGNKAKGITSGVHTPTFDIDENALEIGSGLMAWTALELLRK